MFSRDSIGRIARAASAAVAACVIGCSTTTTTPRVHVPASPEDGGHVKTYAQLRPLRQPSQNELIPPPMFDDVPLVTQAVPEEPAYVDAYNRVGKPRIAVFVNRTVDGQLIPVDGRPSNGSYLAAGQYDDAQAKSIDYAAIELALTDTLAAGGKITLVSPSTARQQLTSGQVNDLQSGQPQAMRDLAEKLDVDVLVQAQARPTRQTAQGLEIRVVVEAINTRGGESVARAFVDLPTPMDKGTIMRNARFLARKTMVGLANSWATMASDPPPTNAAPTFAPNVPPSTQPR